MTRKFINWLPWTGCVLMADTLQAGEPDKHPNVVIILADDLGFAGLEQSDRVIQMP